MSALRHRGPDAEGYWDDLEAGIALGHRRLSILDLSAAGAQPMHSACGRYVIAFNGEIYNHKSLRAELDAAGQRAGAATAWRGTSDTETLLAAIAAWGLHQALRRACGMFALALWDRTARRLSLARDRMGEKPLYLARLVPENGTYRAGGWAFASELGALRALPEFSASLDPSAISAYLAYGYVPETQCIYRGVRKVPAGHVLTLSAPAAEPAVEPFHPFVEVLAEGLAQRDEGGMDEAGQLEDLERILMQVVDEQMLSDVPLGCFLSGGIDSSLVASLMQRQRALPVRTFSIGFSEARFNEAPHAAAVARHLRTEHTEFVLREADALACVPQLASIYDEPFADASQIPTALLCREARRAVSVALTGDGGDEIFGGYNRHVIGPGLLRAISRVPVALRRPAARALQALAPHLVREDGWLRRASTWVNLPVTALDKAVALAPMLAETTKVADLHRHFVRTFHEPRDVQEAGAAQVPEAGLPPELAGLSPAEWMMAVDSLTYLPGDILVKVDRAAMASSLETRAPLLDVRVAAAAWALPETMKIEAGTGKRALRALLARHVPPTLFERPKQGFSIPLDGWLRGELRGWGAEMLAEDVLAAQAGLEMDAVRQLWQDHQAGRGNHGQKLWTVLMLLAWLGNQSMHRAVPATDGVARVQMS